MKKYTQNLSVWLRTSWKGQPFGGHTFSDVHHMVSDDISKLQRLEVWAGLEHSVE
jgi:hypothetical protein